MGLAHLYYFLSKQKRRRIVCGFMQKKMESVEKKADSDTNKNLIQLFYDSMGKTIVVRKVD